MDPETRYLNPSYEEVHEGCRVMAKSVLTVCPNVGLIIGVARGGLIPAVIMSHMLDVPMLAIDYSSKEGRGDDKNHNNTLPNLPRDGRPFLLVDDICDTGRTLHEIMAHYSKEGHVVYIATLFYKTHEKPITQPDIVWRTIPQTSGWVNFPFEGELPESEIDSE